MPVIPRLKWKHRSLLLDLEMKKQKICELLLSAIILVKNVLQSCLFVCNVIATSSVFCGVMDLRGVLQCVVSLGWCSHKSVASNNTYQAAFELSSQVMVN